jgi:hypothetical protein
VFCVPCVTDLHLRKCPCALKPFDAKRDINGIDTVHASYYYRSTARPSTVVTLASELKFEANPENTRDYAPVRLQRSAPVETLKNNYFKINHHIAISSKCK